MKKIVFLGTREIGAACLEYLASHRVALDFEICAALTNDEPIGIGGKSVSEIATSQAIPCLINEDYELVPQQELVKSGRRCEMHFRRKIEDLRRIELDWDRERIERHVRATSMPGYPPPYVTVQGRRLDIVRHRNQDQP